MIPTFSYGAVTVGDGPLHVQIHPDSNVISLANFWDSKYPFYGHPPCCLFALLNMPMRVLNALLAKGCQVAPPELWHTHLRPDKVQDWAFSQLHFEITFGVDFLAGRD